MKVKLLLALAAFFLCANPNRADTFAFTITGSVTAGGTITTGPATDVMGGTSGPLDIEQILSVSGEFNGVQITDDPSLRLGEVHTEFGPQLDPWDALQFAAGDDFSISHEDLPHPDGFANPIFDLTTGQWLGATYLTIVQTPEPATLGILALGFAFILLGSVTRRTVRG
jgi:PEP-CTERM motif-containing protein